MFKTDKKSLEQLAFDFSERDLASLKCVLEKLKSRSLLTISKADYKTAIEGINAIGKLRFNEMIYAFYVHDTYINQQDGNTEGVELHIRKGDRLQGFYMPSSRDFVYGVDRAVEFLKEHNKLKVYTGPIPNGSNFLELPEECDEDNPVFRNVLKDYQIKEFESKGIEVIKLDRLI